MLKTIYVKIICPRKIHDDEDDDEDKHYLPIKGSYLQITELSADN